MKNLFFLPILFALLVCSGTLLGQSNFLPGTVTLKDGQVKTGEIDYREWRQNPKVIAFRGDAGSQKYAAFETERFEVAGELYISAVVRVNDNPYKTDDLIQSDSLKLRQDTIFLQTLFLGKKNLFFYTDFLGREHFLIGDIANPEYLINHRYMAYTPQNGDMIIDRHVYRQQLLTYLEDCDVIKTKISNISYVQGPIFKLFKTYNECVSGDSPTFLFEPPKSYPELGMIAGASISSIKLSGQRFGIDPWHSLSDGEMLPSTRPRFGLFVNFPITRNANQWSMYTELTYASYQAGGMVIGSTSESYNFQLGHIVLTNMFRYRPLPRIAVKPYVAGGIVLSKLINDEALTSTNRRVNPPLRGSAVGVAFSAGFSWRELNIEGRIDRNSNLFNSNNVFGGLNRISILLGYALTGKL